MKLDIIAFTARGAALAETLLGNYPGSNASAPKKYCNGSMQPFHSLRSWTKSRFKTGKTLIFIGSIGIAARAIAHFIRNKASDAAVICIDETGENVIPLLCGHIGGANRTAKKLAEGLNAKAIITTATDLNNVFAIDEWAAKNNCAIADLSVAKQISAALLDGEEVGLHCGFPVAGKLPHGFRNIKNTSNGDAAVSDAEYKYGVEIAIHSIAPFPITLHLIPRIVVAGIGCRKGASVEALEEKLCRVLAQVGIPVEAVGKLATIDIKSDEPGLLALRDKLVVDLKTYSAEKLMSMPGEFEKSERVLEATGADNVCQRAVACAGARLLTGKIAEDGVTIAIGILDWKVKF